MAKKSRLQKKRNYKQKSRTRVKKTRMKRAGKKRGSRKLYGGTEYWITSSPATLDMSPEITKKEKYQQYLKRLFSYLKQSCYDVVKEILEKDESTFVTNFYKYLSRKYKEKLVKYTVTGSSGKPPKKSIRAISLKIWTGLNERPMYEDITSSYSDLIKTEYKTKYENRAYGGKKAGRVKVTDVINTYKRGEKFLDLDPEKNPKDDPIYTPETIQRNINKIKNTIYEAITYAIIPIIIKAIKKLYKPMSPELMEKLNEPMSPELMEKLNLMSEDEDGNKEKLGTYYLGTYYDWEIMKIADRESEVLYAGENFSNNNPNGEFNIPETYLEYYIKAMKAANYPSPRYTLPLEQQRKNETTLNTLFEHFLREELHDFSLESPDAYNDRYEPITLDIGILKDDKKDYEPIEIYLKQDPNSKRCIDKPIWQCLADNITETIDDEINSEKFV